MRFLRKFKASPYFWPLVVVVFFGLFAGKGLVGSGYFNMHDDLQMMRQLQMEKCFLDLQIPCRWVPDMGYGFGFPLFNFYPPLPYLFGEVFRLIGIPFVDTAKLLFMVAFVASGVTMYFLAKEFFSKWGAILSAIFYVWAPYHAVDIYVRGAMNESWALIWFPLVLRISYRLIIEKGKLKWWFAGLAVAWFGLFTSHNLMVLIFTPVFGVWCLLWLVRTKNWRRIQDLLLAGVWSFGLAAFFSIPVLLESKLVQTNNLVVGYYEYVAHFATMSQTLFSRFWGYGPSAWLENGDKMSFQIGHIHWILSLILLGVVAYRFWKNRKLDRSVAAVLFFLIIGWIALFMTHSRSTPIWQAIQPLKFVQFPWRFLTIGILGLSFVAGYLGEALKPNGWFRVIITSSAIISLVVINWNYFLPEHGRLGALTDQEKFSGAAWEMQQSAGIYDYLPSTAKMAPKDAQKYLAEVAGGEALISDSRQGTNWGTFGVSVPGKTAKIRIGIFKFPGWKTFVDGVEAENFIDKDEEWGRMYINVEHGDHKVEVRLYNTWPRTLGNVISLVSWLVLLGYFLWRKRLSLS